MQECCAPDHRNPLPFEQRPIAVLASVARTGRALIVHEAVKPFAVGAEIAARINEALFGQLAAPVQRVGAYSCAVPFSKKLEMEFIPTHARIESAVRATLR